MSTVSKSFIENLAGICVNGLNVSNLVLKINAMVFYEKYSVSGHYPSCMFSHQGRIAIHTYFT